MADLYGVVRPLLHALDPERAHRLAILALKAGLVRRGDGPDDPALAIALWGRRLPNPIGLAAGFDKDAEVPDAMLAAGFGFVEAGSVTPRPQRGNPRPRLFRLASDRAVINRMGFNNGGLAAFAWHLSSRERRGFVGANFGKNKDSVDAIADYVAGARTLAPLADYLVVNVSSPNTPGLRALQERGALADLLGAVKAARDASAPSAPPPLLVKIAPDLAEEDLADIAAVALDIGIDGAIATNTTIARPPDLRDPQAREAGGLSGRPLFHPSTRILARLYRLTGGRLPLIGVGGVSSGAEAYAKIRAGASLVQLYTALVFEGPGMVGRIKRELAALLRRDGFESVAEAVGADHAGDLGGGPPGPAGGAGTR